MLLVTRDLRSAFALDERCILSSRPVPQRAKIERGVSCAWEDIRLAMRRIEPDPDAWEAGYFILFGDAQSFADFLA